MVKKELYHCEWLGRVPYGQAWKYQDELAARVASGESPPTLLLLEHPPTFTFGRRGQANNLLWDEEELRRRGIEVYWVDRGGDVTYHGPGQLVGYPILKLLPTVQPAVPHRSDRRAGSGEDAVATAARIPQADFTGYLRKLERVLIQTLAGLGVAAGQVPGLTGVWVQPDVHSRCRDCPPEERLLPAKIGAIGVKVDARGITRHGFALNVNPDMRHWEGIIGCGLEGYRVTSLAEFIEDIPPIDRVAEETARAFGRVFNVELAGSPKIKTGKANSS